MADQSASAGNDSVVVQIAGDNSTVEIIRAGAKLALNRLHTRKADPTTPIELLRTDIRATNFVGRAEQCSQLAEWRASPQPIAVCCYTGPAGAGKTRLAIEACETAEAEGWIAGFAPSTELARFHATQNLVHWKLRKNALIVIDYAATSLAVLKSWFAALAPHCNGPRGTKLRILLLERQADPEEGWWADLNRRESEKQAGPADLIRKTALHALPALNQLEDRRTLLAETMRKAAPLLDPPAPVLSPPKPGEDTWFDSRLKDDRIVNEPLYLMMAGIHAARHGAPTALALNGIELAAEMAQIETARLEKFARNHGFADNGDTLKHLAACITLQNGCALPSLAALVEQEMAAQNLRAPFSAETVANHLCNFLPSTAGRIEPVRPDLIGESIVLPIIHGGRLRGDDARKAIVLRAYHREAAGTVDTLVRCAQDLAKGAADHPAVQFLSAIVEASENFGELIRIADFVPRYTLSLREFALGVDGQIVSVLRAVSGENPDEIKPLLANALNLSFLALRKSEIAKWGAQPWAEGLNAFDYTVKTDFEQLKQAGQNSPLMAEREGWIEHIGGSPRGPRPLGGRAGGRGGSGASLPRARRRPPGGLHAVFGDVRQQPGHLPESPRPPGRCAGGRGGSSASSPRACCRQFGRLHARSGGVP